VNTAAWILRCAQNDKQMKPIRSVSIANHHPRLRLDRRAVTRAIHALDAHAEKFRGGPPAGELSLVLLTDAALAKLHSDFLADPSTTDVITFEGDAALGVAGEVCVSADAALRQISSRSRTRQSLAAAKLRVRPKSRDFGYASGDNFSAELTLYLVHGWLHLAGYDDLVPAKKRVMRRAEARAMELLRRALCLPHFTLSSRP
jgi:probable rRNA maturation factor